MNFKLSWFKNETTSLVAHRVSSTFRTWVRERNVKKRFLCVVKYSYFNSSCFYFFFQPLLVMTSNVQMSVLILLLDAKEKAVSDDGINASLWILFPFLRKTLVVRSIGHINTFVCPGSQYEFRLRSASSLTFSQSVHPSQIDCANL